MVFSRITKTEWNTFETDKGYFEVVLCAKINNMYLIRLFILHLYRNDKYVNSSNTKNHDARLIVLIFCTYIQR